MSSDPVGDAVAKIRRDRREREAAEKAPPEPWPEPEIPEHQVDFEDLARGPRQVANTAVDAGFSVTAWHSRGTWPGNPPKVQDLVSVRCQAGWMYGFALWREGKHEVSMTADGAGIRRVKVNEFKQWLKDNDPEVEHE